MKYTLLKLALAAITGGVLYYALFDATVAGAGRHERSPDGRYKMLLWASNNGLVSSHGHSVVYLALIPEPEPRMFSPADFAIVSYSHDKHPRYFRSSPVSIKWSADSSTVEVLYTDFIRGERRNLRFELNTQTMNWSLRAE
jgi:hypothetical protein